MGTRSIIEFCDEFSGEPLCSIYRQYDGYPSGRGYELASWLKEFVITNGIPGDARMGRHANGMGCLCAQWIAYEKHEVGNVYLWAYKARGHDIEFVYTVKLINDELIIVVDDAYDQETKQVYTPEALIKAVDDNEVS